MFDWNWLYIAAVFQILAFIIAFVLAVHKFFKRVNIAEALEAESIDRLEERLERIESQFGPNGGGLRQAVNEISRDIMKIEDRVTKIGENLASLSGEFHQHVIENNK
jgi:hypothetical protein